MKWMKWYFITIIIFIVIGHIASYIFNTDPTAETALLIACGALCRSFMKEKNND